MAEEQKKCARCERGNPAKSYDQRTPGHPEKTVDLCDDCAAKDPKVVLLNNEVPKIEPAVPAESETEAKSTDDGFATEEHGPKATEPISIPTPKNAPPTEPIERGAIRDKLDKSHKQLDEAHVSKQRLLAQLEQNKLTDAERNKVTRLEQTRNQLSQVNTVINIKSIEIASYRGILGDEG